MAKILFPSSTSPGDRAPESGGRLINALAEPLGEGAPAGNVIKRAPGLTEFCTTSESAFRGMWWDGGYYIYALIGETFYAIDPIGTETSIATILTPQVGFISSHTDTTNTTAYTYSSVSFGTAQVDRRIVVAVFYAAADDAPAASVTVGGVSATLVVSEVNTVGVALYIAAVPTGTSGDIVVTYATAATRSAIGVWKVYGLSSSTPFDTQAATGAGSIVGSNFSFVTEKNSVVIAASSGDGVDAIAWSPGTTGLSTGNGEFKETIESTAYLSGNSGEPTFFGPKSIGMTTSVSEVNLVAGIWTFAGLPTSVATFAKNNATTPDQVICIPGFGASTFTSSGLGSAVNVNSEIPNSVCYGEGFFFFTIERGVCYASGINATTVSSLDVVRCEARPEKLIRGVYNGSELFLFSETHTEVWASGGEPNETGFPFNRVTVIWRGLVGTLAVTGFEEGFEGGMFWVADDDSVRALQGYDAASISPPELDRQIAAVADKTTIRAFCYDVGGHACVVIDLGTVTWVYDLTTQAWHERKSDGYDYWRATGNSIRAEGVATDGSGYVTRWLVGDHLSGNIYQVDPDVYTEAGGTLEFVAESIAMEAFPQRLAIRRADFNFVAGIGTSSVDDPKCKIQWSDDGGNTWSDPVTRKLGEAGRYMEQVRINRVGLTGIKGRRWRVTVSDAVYVGLLGGDMMVAPRRS